MFLQRVVNILERFLKFVESREHFWWFWTFFEARSCGELWTFLLASIHFSILKHFVAVVFTGLLGVRIHTLHDLWTNTCGLVGVAHVFGTVGHACAISVKSVRRKAKHTHYIERAQECERVFEPHGTRRYGGFFQDSHLKEYHNTTLYDVYLWRLCG